MARLRLNDIGDPAGATNPITLSSPTTTSASWTSAPGFPTITATDYYPIVVEEGLTSEEVVYLTAFTSGATSGTVLRAQEGSTGATHTAKGWIHGPTGLDFGGLATSLGINLVPGNFPNFRKAVANVQSGVGSASIVFAGTSITNGGGVGLFNSTESPPAYLALIMNGLLCPAVQTFGPITPYTNNGTYGDSRWAVGSGWTLPATNGTGPNAGWANNGVAQATTGTGGALVFSPLPGQIVDSFDVYYEGSSSAGTVQASVDGGSNTAIVTHQTSTGVYKQTITCTRGTSHSISLATITVGNVQILGIDAYDSLTPSLHLMNAGVDGLGTSGNWASANALAALVATGASLLVLELGGDDVLVGGVSAATFLTNLQAIISAAQTAGMDVLLWSQAIPQANASPPPGATAAQIATLVSYIQQIIVESVGANIGYVDLTSRFGSYTLANSQGFFNADGVHPSAPGNSDIAAALFEALDQVTSSAPSPTGVVPLVQILSNAGSSITPTTSNNETHWTTSAAGTITINNPTGTPLTGQKMILRIKTSTGAETYSFGGQYRGSTAQALPTTSSNNKWDYLGFEWNSTDSKWDLLALNQGF